MSHSHLHTDESRLPPADARRARLILALLVIPLLAATVAGVVLLWPRGETPVRSVPLTGPGVTLESGTVVEVPEGGAAEGSVRVEVLTGAGAGLRVPVQVPPEVMPSVDVGDDLRLLLTPQAIGTGSPYVFWEFEREAPVGILALVYAVCVLAVARWRGLAAMAGLASSLAVLLMFVVPGLMLGRPPLLVALVASGAMLFLSIYLAHGVSIRTTTALLGTFIGLAVTVVLGMWGTDAANLSGGGSEQAVTLSMTFPELTLSELLLCGMVIAGLGALNDVTITQASAVWELHAANPALSRRRLFGQGMRIGRDHIASTVYTLAFAYVGTALPMILLVALVDRTFMDTLMAGEIAAEVVGTLVASIGLVLAIPATTAIAALLVRTGGRRGHDHHAGEGEPGSTSPARQVVPSHSGPGWAGDAPRGE
ncbi:YibE/F family protein [Georgenia sp. AZ-5]|uniref:YibE/F family protein n=1 Tax=Georgenia sp. AZ-5 TaxID=3367526 RepID=UPI00375523C8